MLQFHVLALGSFPDHLMSWHWARSQTISCPSTGLIPRPSHVLALGSFPDHLMSWYWARSQTISCFCTGLTPKPSPILALGLFLDHPSTGLTPPPGTEPLCPWQQVGESLLLTSMKASGLNQYFNCLSLSLLWFGIAS